MVNHRFIVGHRGFPLVPIGSSRGNVGIETIALIISITLLLPTVVLIIVRRPSNHICLLHGNPTLDQQQQKHQHITTPTQRDTGTENIANDVATTRSNIHK